MPVDQISLNFAKIEQEYKEQKADGTLAGSVKAGWDLKQNKEAS
jgi:type VI secretion system secreted protein Hcp